MTAATSLADPPIAALCPPLPHGAGPPHANQPRRIGEIMPEVLARYGLQPTPGRRRELGPRAPYERQASLW